MKQLPSVSTEFYSGKLYHITAGRESIIAPSGIGHPYSDNRLLFSRYNVEVIQDRNRSQRTDKDGDWPKQPEYQRKSNEEQPVADSIEKYSFPQQYIDMLFSNGATFHCQDVDENANLVEEHNGESLGDKDGEEDEDQRGRLEGKSDGSGTVKGRCLIGSV